MTTYFLQDGLGSTTGLADDDGAVTDTYTYDVFGAMKSHSGSSVNAWLFTGELQDSSVGRVPYYLRARYYDPAMSRFLSRDPLPGLVVRPKSLNPYAYVENGCTNFVDPTGESLTGPPSIFSGEKTVCHGSGSRGFVGANAAPRLFETGGNDILEAIESVLRIVGHGQAEPHRQFTIKADVTVTIRGREATVYAHVASEQYDIVALPQVRHNTGRSAPRMRALQQPTGHIMGLPGETYFQGSQSYRLESGQYPRYVDIQIYANPLLTDWVYDPQSFGFRLKCR